jgi:hypothetical protein
MQVRCEHCHAGYTLPAERLTPGRRVQFSCRHCAQRIVVQVPAAAAEPAPQPAVADPDEPRWFVARAAGSYRKLAESELATAIAGGEVAPEALVWCKGFDEWLPAAQTERWAHAYGADGADASHRHSASAPASEAAVAEQGAGQRRRRSTAVGLGGADDHEASGAAQPAASTHAPPAARRDAASASYSAGGHQGHAPTRQGESGAFAANVEAHARAPSEGHAASAQVEATRFVAAAGDDDDPAVAAAAAAESDATNTNLAVVHQSVAGVSSSDLGQAAVSLPVVRPQRADSGIQRAQPRPAEHRHAPSGRFSPAAQPSGTPIDHRAEGQHAEAGGDDASWAPATDTYIGPRDRFTRRLGSAAERDLLIAQVERARQHREEVRRWQIVAVAACVVAIFALLLATWGMIGRRVAERSLASCTAKTPAAVVAAPAARP